MILAHDAEGSGPHVLLLHAGVADRRMWDPVVAGLSRVFHVVRPDLRGFGDTPLPAEPYVDADDVAALLDVLDIADAVVVGNSLGGRVALELTTRHPGRVRELVLFAPDLPGADPTPDLLAFTAREDELLEAGDVEGAVELNVRTWLGPAADAPTRARVAAMTRHAFDLRLAAEFDAAARLVAPPAPARADIDLDAIAVPTLVVVGDHDLEHFRAVADHLVVGITGAECLRLGWAGLLPALERPDAVGPLLLDVLRDDPDVHAP